MLEERRFWRSSNEILKHTCSSFGVWLNGKPVGEPDGELVFMPCPCAVKYLAVQSTAPRQHCDAYHKKDWLIDWLIDCWLYDAIKK